MCPGKETMTDQQNSGGAQRHSPADGSGCVCVNWCDLSQVHRLLTGHHANCKHAPNVLDCALDLIKDMSYGMECWAADEDGIHPDAWEAYRKAKALEGVILPPNDLV